MSNYQYNRFDVYTVGSNQHNTLRFLQSSKSNKRQKLILGDDTGTLYCITVRKQNDIELLYKSTNNRSGITCVTTYNTMYYPNLCNSKNTDKLYVIYGQSIQCIHKKSNKLLVQYNSILNDNILSCYCIDIRGSTLLYTITQYTINVFELPSNNNNSNKAAHRDNNLIDIEFYASNERLLCYIICVNTHTYKVYNIVGCNDNNINIIHNSNLVASHNLYKSSATALCNLYHKNYLAEPHLHYAVYGTDNGNIGLLSYNDKSNELQSHWTFKTPSTCAVTAMTIRYSTDLLSMDIVVGSEDGELLVCHLSINELHTVPTLRFQTSFNECITNIQCGLVLSSSDTEIVLSTYTGKLICITNDSITVNSNKDIATNNGTTQLINTINQVKHHANQSTQQRKQQLVTVNQYEIEHFGHSIDKVANDINNNVKQNNSGAGNNSSTISNHEAITDITNLQSDIKQLQLKIDAMKQRSKQQQLSSLINTNTTPILLQQTNVPKLRSTFKLNPDATYTLSLELPCNIDIVVLQSSVELYAVHNPTANNEYSMSRTLPDSKMNINNNNIKDNTWNDTLLTLQYNDTVYSNKCVVWLRTAEQLCTNAVLNIYIIPRITPKICIKHEFPIKSLNLHLKQNPDQQFDVAALNGTNSCSLTCSGSYTLNEIHTYICMLLPDINPRLIDEATNNTIYCTNTYINTYLYIEYNAKQCRFISNNVTTLAIVKQLLSTQSTYKNITMSINVQLCTSNTMDVIYSIQSKLDSIYSLYNQIQLIDGLLELQQHSDTDDIAWMNEEYKYILEHVDELRQQYKSVTDNIEYMSVVLCDLYTNIYVLQGKHAKQDRIDELKSILTHERYTFDKLVDIFRTVN